AGKDNVSDVYYTAHFTNQSDKENVKEFLKNYEEAKGSQPDMFAALAYDTVYVVKQALETADDFSAASITKALENLTDFEGVTGTFSFHEHHDPVKAVSIVELQRWEKEGTCEGYSENKELKKRQLKELEGGYYE